MDTKFDVESTEFARALRIALLAVGKGGKGRNVKHPGVLVEVRKHTLFVSGTNGHWLAIYKFTDNGLPSVVDGAVVLHRGIIEEICDKVAKDVKAKADTGNVTVDFAARTVAGLAVGTDDTTIFKDVVHSSLAKTFSGQMQAFGGNITYLEQIAEAFRISGSTSGLRFDFSGQKDPMRIRAIDSKGEQEGNLTVILAPVDLKLPEDGLVTLDAQLKRFSTKANDGLKAFGKSGELLEKKISLSKELHTEAAFIAEVLRATASAVDEKAAVVAEALRGAMG